MLPQEEIDRIEIVPNVRGRHFVMKEASLWYERMGKFAEWVQENNFAQYESGLWYSYTPEDVFPMGDIEEPKGVTTPELINEFLKHKP